MTKKLVGLVLAKSQSSRLPGKNSLDFHGRPMFLVNVEKLLKVFNEVYVSSDSEEILWQAQVAGAIPIVRNEGLCGDTPNIPVYQACLERMGDVGGIVAVQASSPNVDPRLILTARGLLELGYKEVMTSHPIENSNNYHEQGAKIYGSVWGIEVEKLKNYGDPYKPTPEVLLVDTSEDIHYHNDYITAKLNHVR